MMFSGGEQNEYFLFCGTFVSVEKTQTDKCWNRSMTAAKEKTFDLPHDTLVVTADSSHSDQLSSGSF